LRKKLCFYVFLLFFLPPRYAIYVVPRPLPHLWRPSSQRGFCFKYFWCGPFDYLYFSIIKQNWVQESILAWLLHHFHLALDRDWTPTIFWLWVGCSTAKPQLSLERGKPVLCIWNLMAIFDFKNIYQMVTLKCHYTCHQISQKMSQKCHNVTMLLPNVTRRVEKIRPKVSHFIWNFILILETRHGQKVALQFVFAALGPSLLLGKANFISLSQGFAEIQHFWKCLGFPQLPRHLQKMSYLTMFIFLEMTQHQ